MHICQTFIYRSIYFLFFKNLYEIYHIYIACDFFKKANICSLFVFFFTSVSMFRMNRIFFSLVLSVTLKFK